MITKDEAFADAEEALEGVMLSGDLYMARCSAEPARASLRAAEEHSSEGARQMSQCHDR